MIRHCIAGVVMAASIPAAAFSAPSTPRIALTPAAPQKIAKGRIKGYANAEYLVSGVAGQKLTATLKTSNTSSYFNIAAPGADEALFVGSVSGGTYQGVLPTSGDYRITVYLMRNAARRNETANYSLSVTLGNQGRKTSGRAQ